MGSVMTNEELQELSVTAVRGMRIDLAAWLTDEICECGALLHERQVRKPGYLRSWRWRVGCRLLERLQRWWPPELADERELRLFVRRVTRFLAGRAMNRVSQQYTS